MNDLPPVPEDGVGQAAETGGAMRTGLPADRTPTRQACPAIRQVLATWRMEHLSSNAELLASEMVANAAEHGDGKPIGLARAATPNLTADPASPARPPTARRSRPGTRSPGPEARA
jgi:hypothetical protein